MSGRVGMRKGARVTVVCLGCERPFETLPSRLRLGRGLYCSARCSAPVRREAAVSARTVAARLPADIARASAPRVVSIPANGRRSVRFTGRCPHCSGSAFDVEWPPAGLDRPHPAEVATVICLLCGRRVLRLKIGGAS